MVFFFIFIKNKRKSSSFFGKKVRVAGKFQRGAAAVRGVRNFECFDRACKLEIMLEMELPFLRRITRL
jgi:hypothetical protein